MRTLYATPAFKRMSRDFLVKNPHLKKKLIRVIKILEEDVFSSVLKTHKLHGDLRKLYACRISYDYRIVFELTEKKVILYGVGSHDELY